MLQVQPVFITGGIISIMETQTIEAHLKDKIIPFWKKLIDRKNGGFISFVSYNLAKDENAPKGCILNSRILWFFSQGAITLADSSLIPYADHAYAMLQKMTDEKNGGVYWSVNADGSVSDGTKHTYNQAFAIYALSAYYQLTRNVEALERAIALYKIVETKCRDEGGYLEAFTVDWQPESNEKLSENGVMAERTMNTLLHVMEGLTALYLVWPDKALRRDLYEILDIFEKKIYNPEKKRQEVFFDHEYRSLIDLHSYGHDIETSWLAEKTLKVLKDDTLTSRIQPLLLSLAEKTYESAWTKNGFLNECERGVNNNDRIWWVQAEALIGFLNAWEKTGEEKYLEAADSQWRYIEASMIDPREEAEWYWSVHEDGTADADQPIVSPWKCPYHNGRMAFEVLERSRNENISANRARI